MTRSVTLGEMIDTHGGLIQTGPFGSQLHQSDYVESGIPVVMPKDIRDGRVVEDGIARIMETKAQSLSRHYLKTGSIVFPRRGEISKCAYIDEEHAGLLCGTGCIKIEPPEDILNPRFLYYYLGLRHVVEWLERNAVGTTMLNLNTKIISGIKIPEIRKSIQDKIVSILSAYDDLIENNRRRIQLLEQAARLLYKEWFVHLRFPGHEHVKIKDGVPEGWEKKTYAALFEFLGGFAFKSKTYLTDGRYGVVTIKNVHDARFVPECPSRLDAPPEKMKEHCLLKTGDILLSLTGNVGRACIVYGDNYLLNQRVAKVVGKSGIPASFVYWTFSNDATQRELENLAYGVAQLNLSPVKLGERDFIEPPRMILDLFADTTEPIFSQICTLNMQNKQLEKARDLLLPKLMNGEVAA